MGTDCRSGCPTLSTLALEAVPGEMLSDRSGVFERADETMAARSKDAAAFAARTAQ